MRLLTSAKINLNLQIFPEKKDNFHKLSTMMIPINIFVHEYLQIYFAVIINVISFLLFIAGITIYMIVIQRKQRFVIDNDHTIQRTVFHND